VADLPLHPPPRIVIDELVKRALLEDLGRGDVTTDACVASELTGSAELIARVALVLAGIDVFEAVFAAVDPAVRIERRAGDGQRLAAKTVAAVVSGPSASILKGERVALNFAQRMSGVATKTRQLVDALRASPTPARPPPGSARSSATRCAVAAATTTATT
jgi:nicotinate-nucleotide pyrophosphorylase (carboxylating)